jgi:XrtJ-associated TM-motif-TM protein
VKNQTLETKMNLKRIALTFVLMLAVVLPLRAQSGCDDSPENPTVVLGLVAGAGMLVAGMWRSRRR